MEKKIKIYHNTIEVRLTDKTSIYSDKPDDCGYLLLEMESASEKQRVKFRRVDNQDATLQFEIKTYKKDTNRTKYDSFSVPQKLVETFINHLLK